MYSVRTGRMQTRLLTPKARFHELDDCAIETYLQHEPDACRCSGGLRIEGPGMLLIHSIETNDAYAIEGMPINTLSQMTLEWGMPLHCFSRPLN